MTEEVQPVEATEAQVETAENIAEQHAEPAPAPAAEEKQKVDPVQRRIDKLTRDKYEARAKAQMLEEEVKRLREASQPKPTQTDDKEPTPDQFQTWEDYSRALARHEARREAAEMYSRTEKERQAESQRQEQAKASQSWQKRASEFRKEHPDFDDVLESADVEVTPALQHAIVDSDMGPKIAYYLAQNPEEAERISSLSPVAIARAIGRIEAKLEGEALAKTKSEAPKPPTPVAGRGVAESGPNDNQSVDDWLRARNKQIAERLSR